MPRMPEGDVIAKVDRGLSCRLLLFSASPGGTMPGIRLSRKEVTMPLSTASAANWWTVADLLDRLGSIPPPRVRLNPPPGQATEKAVLAIHQREGLLCELVDGVLVEKPMRLYESRLAIALSFFLETFLSKHNLGFVV